MIVAHTIDSVRQAVTEARSRGSTIGLAPTMGALHAGHVSLIRSARQEAGFVVVPAANGEEAIARLREFRPSLVLLDLVMADVSACFAAPAGSFPVADVARADGGWEVRVGETSQPVLPPRAPAVGVT